MLILHMRFFVTQFQTATDTDVVLKPVSPKSESLQWGGSKLPHVQANVLGGACSVHGPQCQSTASCCFPHLLLLQSRAPQQLTAQIKICPLFLSFRPITFALSFRLQMWSFGDPSLGQNFLAISAGRCGLKCVPGLHPGVFWLVLL